MKHYLDFLNNSCFTKQKLWIYGSFILVLVYLSPLFFYGGSLHFLAFDNLDSNVVWYKILAESGKIFSQSSAIIPNMMSGLPRISYPSEFDILLWLYYFFTPLHAYIVNEILLHTVAYFSMYLFLIRCFFKPHTPYSFIYSSFGAFYFATLPFLPSSIGLSISLMPLITYALIRIKNNQNSWQEWLILCLFPLYSTFIVVYFFYFLLAGLFYFYLATKERTWHIKFLFALLLPISIFLIKDYRLFSDLLIDHLFISHRSEYYSLVSKSFWESYKNAHIQFLNGVPHAKGIHLTLLLPLSIYAIVLSFFPKKLPLYPTIFSFIVFILLLYFHIFDFLLTQKYSLPFFTLLLILLYSAQKKIQILSLLILSQITIAYWYGFSHYKGWNTLFEFIPQLKMFNFSRFFFISQMLWGIIAAVSLKIIFEKLHFTSLLIVIVTIAQLFIAINESYFNLSPKLYHLPFNKYYAVSQFQDIKQYIGKKQSNYRVVCLGIEPAVPLYNGFNTIDGQSSNYPLQYKHTFRKIIAKHLEEHPIDKKLFDGWGNKVYMFANQAGYSYKNENDIYVHQIPYTNIDINSSQLFKMHTQYLLSSRKILNSEALGLNLLKVFPRNQNTLWNIWLYYITPQKNKKEIY